MPSSNLSTGIPHFDPSTFHPTPTNTRRFHLVCHARYFALSQCDYDHHFFATTASFCAHTNSPISRGPQHYSIYQGGACVIGFAQVPSNADSVVVNSHEFKLLSSYRSKNISCSSRHFHFLCNFNHCAKAKSNHHYSF